MEILEIKHGSASQVQTGIIFYTDVWFRPIIFRDAENWKTEALEKLKWSKPFTRISDSRAKYIEMLENKRGSTRQIQKTITFDSDADSGQEYIDMLEIEQRRLSRNSNRPNFSLSF